MRLLIFLLPLAMLSACNSEDKANVKSATSTDSSSTTTVVYPYEITYSSQFAISDPAQSKIILDLWKDFDQGNLSNSADKFADSVSMYLAEGAVMHTSRDSMIAMTQRYRNSFSKVESRVAAVLPARSTDKNENWVSVWGTEYDTYPDGKVDSVNLMETWRFDSSGKVNLMMQYKRMFPKSK